MSEEDDELERWRKSRGIPDEETQRQFSPELRWLRLFEKLSERVETNDEESRRRDEELRRTDEELRRRDEERQHNIDFIIRQQAQFAADMQQMREAQARAEERWERRWGRTEESIRALLSIAEFHNSEISTLTEAQRQTDKQIAETNAQLAETNERLNALINTVERYISERRNGGRNT